MSTYPANSGVAPRAPPVSRRNANDVGDDQTHESRILVLLKSIIHARAFPTLAGRQRSVYHWQLAPKKSMVGTVLRMRKGDVMLLWK